MFSNKSVATFDVNGHRAMFLIDNDMPVVSVQAILNKLTHFCVERIKEVENEEAQQKKDAEAVAPQQLPCAEVCENQPEIA